MGRFMRTRGFLGWRLRGSYGTQRSKIRVLIEGSSQKGSEKGAFFYGIYSKKGFSEGFSEGVLRRQLPEGA